MSLLNGEDLSLAYHFILTSYVDQVDYATLIDAARGGVAQSLAEAGVLPVESAPMDLLPLPTGNAERDWQTFSNSLVPVLQRRTDWSIEARPDYLAVRKMIESLNDSHSTLITADDARRRAESTYSGIGVRLTRQEPRAAPVIVEVFPSGPAAVAGVRPGDRIIAVDGRDVGALPLSEIADLVRGQQGSEVMLQLERSDARSSVTARAFRRVIETPVAEGALIEPKIGYIRIRTFTETTADRVGRLLVEFRQAGAEALLLDLRGNPGGNLRAVQQVAGYFMDPRPIGISVDRAGQREAVFAEQRPLQPSKLPLVTVIDGDSGSGSELLAAALREYQLARLVGQTSAGSVGIANTIPLSDGSSVQLTVRRLLSPAGATLDRAGVQPDVSVPLTLGDLEQGRDPQRDRALELLRQR